MDSPLKGIRVLDFGRYIAGPFCASLLADFGAEVIRVEKVAGSEDRNIAPVVESGEGGMYLQLARNKKGMTLNLHHPQVDEVFRRLVASSDVVVANLPESALQRLGLNYQHLTAIRQDIILVSNTAFGTEGPYADRVGFDGIAQAMSGNMDMSGYPDEPMKSYVPHVDFCTASLAAFGTVLALWHRDRTGEGQRVQSSLLATALTLSNSLVLEQQLKNINRTATGNRGQTSGPSSAFATSDGWILMQMIGPKQFAAWAELVGVPEWVDDPRFTDDLVRGDNGELLCDRMAKWCATRSTEEVLASLDEARIPGGPVLRAAQVLNEPHIAAAGLYRKIPWPDEQQKLPVADTPIKLSQTSGSVSKRAPHLGEHNDEILAGLGYREQEIGQLRNAGVI